MVLINNLTIDEINAALLHLQRSRGEVVGGNKGNTTQNISITNTSTGVDYSTQIARLEKNVEDLQQVDEELKDKDKEIIEKLDALGLIGIGIDNLDFDPSTRVLSIFTTDGEEYTTTLTSEEVSLTFDSLSNKLVFTMGEQTQEVTLPYINASEKGVANGVATLDATGRVPYSQLPESAMEFKGEWNANTNTPELKDEHGTNGDFYICNVGGTANFGTTQNPRTITFYVNDRVIYQGNVAQWKRLPASEVRTVNGQSGDVTLNGTNVNYSDASNSPTLKDKIDTVEGYAKTQSDWGQTNTSAIDFIKNKPSLATVATSGSYNDLSNKPTIPAAQIQSDWTQTDSTKKDFIKNKIPIWITTGSADDNMSPIDSVTNGSMRPVTSNAVADIMSNLPTDAVLHYSFDELPDYPDGTAVYKNIKNFSSVENWISTGSSVVSVENNGLKITNASVNYLQVINTTFNANNLSNKIIKIKYRANTLPSFRLQDYGGNYGTHLFNSESLGNGQYQVLAQTDTYSYNQIFTFNFNSASANNYVVIDEIYIGNGSYSTPIIDNANGQNNAVNNGGIAVNGVSGKSAYFLNGKYANCGNINLTSNFSISVWVKPDNNTNGLQGVIYSKAGQIILRNGASWGNFLMLFIYAEDGTFYDSNIGSLLTADKWTHLVITREGTTVKVYIDGALSTTRTLGFSTISNNTYPLYLCYDWGANTRPQSLDDFQIFNRVLSEQEVKALYLNKANTPKYYSWADWKLSQL